MAVTLTTGLLRDYCPEDVSFAVLRTGYEGDPGRTGRPSRTHFADKSALPCSTDQ
jgi:hypothetical protein